MLTHGGSLLEHFARLAANVAGTASAIVGVLGQRKESGPRRAAFGMTREQLAAVHDIEDVLDRGGALTVIPDLTRDDRLGARAAPFEHAHLRFLTCLRLLSPGGERVGFVCVLDEAPRDGLTAAQLTALGHVAAMVMADRQREQRHLHLMHVAGWTACCGWCRKPSPAPTR